MALRTLDMMVMKASMLQPCCLRASTSGPHFGCLVSKVVYGNLSWKYVILRIIWCGVWLCFGAPMMRRVLGMSLARLWHGLLGMCMGVANKVGLSPGFGH